MALTKVVVIDQIEIREDGQIKVQWATRIMEDGVELSKTYHRQALSPGEDYSREDVRVRDIAAVVHTAAVIAAYKATHP